MVVQFLKNVGYYVISVLFIIFSIPAIPFLIMQDVRDKLWARGWTRTFWKKV